MCLIGTAITLGVVFLEHGLLKNWTSSVVPTSSSELLQKPGYLAGIVSELGPVV